MKFILDENIPKQIAEALNVLDRENEVLSVHDLNLNGTSDVELIPKLGKQNAYFITHDLKQKTRKKESKLFFEHDVSTFIISFKSGAKHWDKVLMLINNWEEIKNIARKNHKTTFVYRVKVRGKNEFLFGKGKE